MKLSDLITRLQYAIDEHGDIPVMIHDMEEGLIDIRDGQIYRVIGGRTFGPSEMCMADHLAKSDEASIAESMELWDNLEPETRAFWKTFDAMKDLMLQSARDGRLIVETRDTAPKVFVL
jgi:hypothetical protein